MAKVINKEKKICHKCNEELPLDKFYNASEMLFPLDGKLNVCSSCVGDMVEIGGMSAFLTILHAIDKPFYADKYKGNPRGYIRQVNSLPQYKNKRYEDGDNFSAFNAQRAIEDDESLSNESIYSPEQMRELYRFWGKGKDFNDDDYICLQNEFERLTTAYECDSYSMEILFQDVAHQRLAIKKLREEGKPVDKELKTLQDLLGSANIKPVQETGANATEQATFGTLIKKYENERPIPEPDPEWKDVDGIKKYIQVWFFGHLCRMLGINNEYSVMYEAELSKYTVDAPQYDETDESVN